MANEGDCSESELGYPEENMGPCNVFCFVKDVFAERWDCVQDGMVFWVCGVDCWSHCDLESSGFQFFFGDNGATQVKDVPS